MIAILGHLICNLLKSNHTYKGSSETFVSVDQFHCLNFEIEINTYSVEKLNSK